MSEHTPGALVKSWRKAHGLTIDALAAALGLTTGPMKMIEANRRKLSADEARAIARAEGVCTQQRRGCSGEISKMSADEADFVRRTMARRGIGEQAWLRRAGR